MTKPISSSTTTAGSPEAELGTILAERKRLGSASGRCSAAQAESLRKLRDLKLYVSRCVTWDEFCPRYLGLTKVFANRAIEAWEEFGPAFFELAELTRITRDEFRAVASRVNNKMFHADGEAIALTPENASRVATALEKLRRSSAAPIKPYTPTVNLSRMTLLEAHCTELISEFRKLTGPKAQNVDRAQLAAILRQTLGMLGRIELDLGVF